MITEEVIKGLYIEPDETAFKFYSSMLAEWFGDYLQFTWKGSLKESESEINSGKFDLIVSELIFPGEVDHPRGTIQFLMDQPGSADVPIVIITKSEDQALSINSFRNGVAEFFSKVQLNKPLLEYRMRNLLQREYRTKIIYNQINDSLSKFQKAHGMSQEEIKDLNAIVQMMKQELAQEYEKKMELEAEKNKIQSIFGRYVDPSIVKGIMNNEISLDQKGQLQEITVLFTDIRGYTSMSEKMEAEQIISFLNEYFTSMSEVIMGYNGMVDKYIGDSIMCVFGAPIYEANHREQALNTALEMQNVFDLWKGSWEANYGIVPQMGIGVASGKAVVGNVGSFQKISYTAVGDTVNVAARLEGIAKGGQVLISEDMFQNLGPEIRDQFNYLALEPVAIKGKTGLHQIYSVSDI